MMTKRTAYRLSSFSGPFLMVGLLVMCLVVGCTRGLDPRLSKADTKMEANPDSALMILEGIDIQKLTRDEDRALYGLLYTQARDKNHLALEDDSLIGYSLQYYQAEHNSHRLAKSHYFLGRVLYQQGRYSGAIVSFHKALDLADHLNDYHLAGMACRGIADIYNKTYNSSDEVKFAEKELEYLRLSQRQPYLNYALLDLAQSLYSDRDIKRMDYVLIAAEDSARLYEDEYLLSEVRRLKGLSFIRDHEYEAACPFISDICSGPYADQKDSLLFALTLAAVGQPDNALMILSGIDNEDTPMYHTVRYNLYKANGEYGLALKEQEYLDSVANRSLRKGISHGLAGSLSDYFELDRRVVKAELKAFRLTLMATVLLSFIIIIIFGVGIALYVRSNRRKLEEKMRIAENLRAEVELQKKNVLKNEEDKRLLLTDNFQVLEDFGRIMMENPDSKKALRKSAEAVSRLLDELSCWGERTKELERKVDLAYDDLFSDFREDMPGLKDADYLLYLYSILHVSIPTISIILKESKIESVYNRKRRLKDKIKLLDATKTRRYIKYL